MAAFKLRSDMARFAFWKACFAWSVGGQLWRGRSRVWENMGVAAKGWTQVGCGRGNKKECKDS